MGIKFYCGINETKWNYYPVSPGEFSCISPVYRKSQENRVFVPKSSEVLQDSGAFSDHWNLRLSFHDALNRQLEHGKKFDYDEQITHRVSYDLLVDEKWSDDGNRHKERWNESDAEEAVSVTVNAAKFLSENYRYPKVLSLQGVTSSQYLECAKQIVPFKNNENDVIGLGGWCIVGKMRKQMMPVFLDTIEKIIPFLSKESVNQVHIFGVIYPDALGTLLWLCDQFGIKVSTDSAGPQFKPALGSWGYGDWRDKRYKRPSVETRGQERARHVELTREWLKNFRLTKYYIPYYEHKYYKNN